MQRTIVKAAVKYTDKIYTGFDHGECFKKLNEDNMIIVHSRIEQGFVDNDGIFVDRKQAMVIAKEAGQLSYETNKKTLISEDLHLNWLRKQAHTIDVLEKALNDCIEENDLYWWSKWASEEGMPLSEWIISRTEKEIEEMEKMEKEMKK